MLCQMCRKKRINGHYIQIAFGKKFVDLYVCEDCTKKLLEMSGLDIDSSNSFSFDNLLKIFFTGMDSEVDKNQRCPLCGRNFEDFQKSGILGCPDCYDYFHVKIDPIVINYQGSNKHIGKNSKYKEDVYIKQKNVNKDIIDQTKDNIDLKIELQKAIEEERFEDAAILRDKIKESENQS